MNPPQDAAVHTQAGAIGPALNGAARAGLPIGTVVERLPLPTGEPLDMATLVVPDTTPAPAAEQDEPGHLAAIAADWVAAAPASEGTVATALPPVHVPLYGSHVVWSPTRAAVIGPPARVPLLRAAVLEFASREAELRDAERRAARLLAGSEADAEVAFVTDGRLADREAVAAARYRDAVAVRCRLAGLSAAIHAPPQHPPTLASQLGERLRDRTRLSERHEHAVEKADLAERVAEACGHRAADLAIARRQLGLEWAIVALLVAQTALALVDLLAGGSTP